MTWPPRDRLNRIQPHGFRWISWVRAFPWLMDFFGQSVPAAFWSIDSYADGEEVALVACPCGEEPTVAAGHCTECACGRFYLHAGSRIRVARPEEIPASLPADRR